ncbi:hypothetical protein B0H14DRAFT_3562092 [Mycena olivaceomarginata]|nr:hypothetical protein B0H14DRAFT_3562092 [Mycena olivaceomarginata]
MAVRHQSALYSPPSDLSISSDRNAQFHSPPIYGANVGTNTYRYRPHAASVDAPLHYGYGDVPNVVNLSQALEGSAIRQSALPRLQIPTRASPELSSPLRSQRVDIPASFHSAAVTLSYHVEVPPSNRSVGPCRRQTYRRTSNTTICTRPEPDCEYAGVEQCCERECESPQSESSATSSTNDNDCSHRVPAMSRAENSLRLDASPLFELLSPRRSPDKKPGTRQRRCKKRADSREEEDELELAHKTPGQAGTRSFCFHEHDCAAISSAYTLTRLRFFPGRGKEGMRQQHPTPTPNMSSHNYGRPIRPLIHVPSQGPAPLRISTDESVLVRHAIYGRLPRLTDTTCRPLRIRRRTIWDTNPQCLMSTIPSFRVSHRRAVQAAQQGWWDAFLRSYSLREIATDLNFLYTESPVTLSFVNVGFLLETLWSPTKYLTLQPAFILASMALAVLIRSSETERGAAGRERAAFLRHSAQDTLERTWREGVWLDASLAEAALVRIISSPSTKRLRTPSTTPTVSRAHFAFLDEVISALGLTTIDAGNPDVCRYAPGACPCVDVQPDAQCACFPPGTPPPDPDRVWSSALPWDPSWGEHEIRDEECRRVSWAALTLVTSFRMECIALTRPDDSQALRICDPSNYLALFPNELYDRNGFGRGRQEGGGPTAHPKNAIWALYCRSMLLFNFCSNVVARNTENRDERESQAEALQESWNEAQAIQDTLDGHGCICIPWSPICAGRTFPRPAVRKSSRPLFNRRQAEEWIYSQAEVVKRATMSIQYVSDPRGHHFTQRPYAVTWFYHQLAIGNAPPCARGSQPTVGQGATNPPPPLDLELSLPQVHRRNP